MVSINPEYQLQKPPLGPYTNSGAAHSTPCHYLLLLLYASGLERLNWIACVHPSATRTWPGVAAPSMIVKWTNEPEGPVTLPWRTLSPVFMGSTLRNDWTSFHVKLNMFVLKSASCDPNQDMFPRPAVNRAERTPGGFGDRNTCEVHFCFMLWNVLKNSRQI